MRLDPRWKNGLVGVKRKVAKGKADGKDSKADSKDGKQFELVGYLSADQIAGGEKYLIARLARIIDADKSLKLTPSANLASTSSGPVKLVKTTVMLNSTRMTVAPPPAAESAPQTSVQIAEAEFAAYLKLPDVPDTFDHKDVLP